MRRNVSLGKSRGVIDTPRAYIDSRKTAAQERDKSPFGKHDAAAGALCHRSNKPRQPQLLSDAILRNRKLGSKCSTSEIAPLPFGNRTLLLEPSGRMRSSHARS